MVDTLTSIVILSVHLAIESFNQKTVCLLLRDDFWVLADELELGLVVTLLDLRKSLRQITGFGIRWIVIITGIVSG